MTFTCPKVGAKVYLSRGPSGHAETFERTACDHALELFIGGKVKLHIAVEGFIRKMLLDRRVGEWPEVIDYLAERNGLDSADDIPINIGVAFWAHVERAREAARVAKLEEKLAAHGS